MRPDADWCQRWAQRRHTWRHRSEGGFDARRYEVAALDEAGAKTFVERNHYSASYPAARLRYGLWHGVALVGVAVLSVPVQRAVLANAFPELAPYAESLELGRFVLADGVPANGESWFLARAFRLAEREGIRGVVSFSDPMPRRTAGGQLVFPGHVGIIYQASNASYTGRTEPRALLLLPDGRVLNARSLSKVRNGERGHEHVEALLRRYGAPARGTAEPRAWLADALGAVGARRVRHPGNHRYLFHLGRVRAFAVPTLPYPKVAEVAS